MYTEFADIYDILMKDTEYQSWADFYSEIFKKYGLNPKLVLDLGCGTGTLTEIMSKRGYDMTGIDSSCMMLDKALKKSDGKTLYLNQDMTDFELYGTMGAIVSSLDCINYITDEDDLYRVFKLVNNYLDYDGVFIFDINTKYKLKNILNGHCYTYDEDGIYYTWESFYDDKSELCDFYLTFFVEDEDLKYTRINEYQTERAWEQEKLNELLTSAGFSDVEFYADRKMIPPSDHEERIFITARKRA